MKSKTYINEMNDIHASEELIQKTIKGIKEVQKFEKNRKIKKVIAGATAALTLSIGSVAAYVAITGNTEILQKIGIKLSQNYEQNEQIITNENDNQNKIDWTKAWSSKYPVLSTYQKEVNIPKYAKEIRKMFNELQETYHYSELDAMLVLKDILAHEYLDKK